MGWGEREEEEEREVCNTHSHTQPTIDSPSIYPTATCITNARDDAGFGRHHGRRLIETKGKLDPSSQ